MIEAKGGKGKLRGQQGTIEDAIRAAKRIITGPVASTRERKTARLVLEYAAERRVRPEPIRTPHIRGVAGIATLFKDPERPGHHAQRRPSKGS